MQTMEHGSIVSPQGFSVGTARAGIKQAEQPDVAVIVSDRPCSAAGIFTTNRFASPTIAWNRAILPCADLRAVVVNSGNANACTGSQGEADVRAMATAVAEQVGCSPEQVCVASTGIIGHLLPMERVLPGVRRACGSLSGETDAARMAERAIMTTDTRPKSSAVSYCLDDEPFVVAGIAKGSGMIAPNMATMLVFMTTDAAIQPEALATVVRETAGDTFNRITVDGDTSTNDLVVCMANGASSARVKADGSRLAKFQRAVHAVMADLSLQIVRDGEGATRMVEVTVEGAGSEEEAEAVARSVARSQLFKCAVAGGDPNWGRIVCAVGYSGVAVDPNRVGVTIGGTCVFEHGRPTGLDASASMAQEEVLVHIDLGQGHAGATVWTCDLTKRYVEINAEYHT